MGGEGCKPIEKYICLIYILLPHIFASIKREKQDLENALAEHLQTIYFYKIFWGKITV